MLSSDKGDSIAERLSMKANPGVTTNELEEFMFEVREEVKFGGAAQELAALKQSMDDAGKETQAAARAQKLLTMSMNALDTLRKTLDNQNQMTGPKARVRAPSRFARADDTSRGRPAHARQCRALHRIDAARHRAHVPNAPGRGTP